jgi:uncharacterized integral membrane protein
MIRRIVGWVVLVPLCLALVVFALINTDNVQVRFNPFGPKPDANTGLPLFVVFYGVLLLGVILGGIATWFAQSAHRRDERNWRREAERLRRDLEDARRTPSVPAVTVDDLVKS